MSITKRKIAKRRFTLIELVVSMGVFSVLMLMLMTFFNGAQKLWTMSEKRNALYADARVAMDMMAGMLQTVAYQSEPTTNMPRMPFYVVKSGTSPYCNDKMVFFTYSPIPLANNIYSSSLYKVGYALDLNSSGPASGYANDSPRYNNLCINFYGDTEPTLWDFYDNYGVVTYGTSITTFANISNSSYAIVNYALGLEIKCYKADMSTISSPVQQLPAVVEIRLTLLDATSYKRWLTMGGANSADPGSSTDPALTFMKENAKTFSRMVYLGNRF